MLFVLESCWDIIIGIISEISIMSSLLFETCFFYFIFNTITLSLVSPGFRFENQREQLSQQSCNIEQQNYAICSMRDTKTTV